MEAILPVGPVKLRLDAGVRGVRARSLVPEARLAVKWQANWLEFSLPSIEAHEVVVIE